jgi:hypothetical protein
MSFEANYGKGPRFTVSDRRRLIADEGGGAEAAQLLDEGVGAHPSARRVDERSGALRGPGRRSLLAACSISMLCGATFPRTANALSHSQVRKDPRMATAALSTRVLSVEHVTIQSRNGFDAVKTKLEALLPRLDDGIFILLRYGESERALRELEAAPTLSIFSFRDHGALLTIAGMRRRAIQYDIGNPLTATKMTRHELSAALYAPIRVLLREDGDGGAAFEYDRPVSVFGQFGNVQVDVVARPLDEDLKSSLEAAAS